MNGYHHNRFFFSPFFFVFLVFLILPAFPVLADNFWEEHAIGWHWYEEPVQVSSEEAARVVAPDPVQIMESFRQEVKRSLDQAILNPTPANMRHYITLQNQVGAQASRFAVAWQAALLNYPALNYGLSHPTNNMGKQVFLEAQKAEEDKAIELLAKHSGLFFFYHSTCPYCQRFAPIVKNFSTRYGISVVPITTDGIALPEFPNSHPDQGQAARFQVSVEPALFTVDPYSQKIIPVGYGLMSEDELRTRILAIATESELIEAKP